MILNIFIIGSITAYGIINVIRLMHNVKNKDLIVNIYPDHIKKQWLKVYANPFSFIFKRSLLRLMAIGIFLYFIFKNTSSSSFHELLSGFILYVSFITIFDELKALFSQIVMVNKIKDNEANDNNASDALLSLLIFTPVYFLIGVIPVLFIAYEFNFYFLGCLSGGLFYFIFQITKIKKFKDNIDKAAANR